MTVILIGNERYRRKQQYCTETPSCGTEFTALEKTKIIIKMKKLNLRSILWPKHSNFNANDEHFWSSCHNKVRSGLPITGDSMNENDGSCDIPEDSASRLCIMKGQLYTAEAPNSQQTTFKLMAH
jgi:hypothetical protein